MRAGARAEPGWRPLHSSTTDRLFLGLPLSTYFTGVKLRWLIDEEPRIKAKLEAGEALVGTVDRYCAEQVVDHV